METIRLLLYKTLAITGFLAFAVACEEDPNRRIGKDSNSFISVESDPLIEFGSKTESGSLSSVKDLLESDSCGYIRLCDDLDLPPERHIEARRYSKVALCHLEALIQKRSGKLLIHDGNTLWHVLTGISGKTRAYAVRKGDDDERVRVCSVDDDYLADCRAPHKRCLDPKNWTTDCEYGQIVCPGNKYFSLDCVPAVRGPIWITEGDPLSLDMELVCREGAEMKPSDLVFDDLPPGASYDERRGRLTWTPGLDQAAVYNLSYRDRTTGIIYQQHIGVADAFDHPDNEPIVDPERYPLEYGLPVFFIEDAENNEYHRSKIVYAGRRYDEVDIKTRGETSLEYPKHSYTLKFRYKDLFQEPRRGGGLIDRKKLVLITTFDDNSYLRQRLSHEMWAILNPKHIAVRSFMAIVYRDNKFRGLYTVSDHIDRHLIQHHGLADTGELFKSKKHEGDFLHTRHKMEKKEGLPEQGESGWDDSLQELIQFVKESNDDAFAEHLADYINIADYQDWWTFIMFTGNIDSTGKNVYHYLESEDEVFRFVPWDFNASFGQRWNTKRGDDIGSMFHRNEIWRRMADNPTFRDEMRDRFLEALHGPYAISEILDRLDAYFAEVEAGSVRDWNRWEDEYKDFKHWSSRDDFTTVQKEIDYVRDWISKRWAYVEENLDEMLIPTDD